MKSKPYLPKGVRYPNALILSPWDQRAQKTFILMGDWCSRDCHRKPIEISAMVKIAITLKKRIQENNFFLGRISFSS